MFNQIIPLKYAAPLYLLSVLLFGCVEQKKHSSMSENIANGDVAFRDTATFGTGCFWCTEALFERLEGVTNVVSGYAGSKVPNPSYEEVTSGTTGAAEVCQITFDPNVISYQDLLKVFWEVHDPTTLNRQGNDVGPQYRSVIFFHDKEQEALAKEFKRRLNESGAWDKPVVTAIEPLSNFYAAENYHQDYYINNIRQPYCQYVIKPKMEKFERVFKDKLKAD